MGQTFTIGQILAIGVLSLLTVLLFVFRPTLPAHNALNKLASHIRRPNTPRPPPPATPIVYIEIGANNGFWTDFYMTNIAKANLSADCYLFEVQPKLLNGRLKTVADRHNCTIVPYAVWDRDGEVMTFSVPTETDEAGTLFTDSAWLDKDSNVTTFQVTTINITRWFIENINPKSFMQVRLDIEGAEYKVWRSLIHSGVACWFDILEYEGHFSHRLMDYPMAPVDMFIPWLLKECGVYTRYEHFIKNTTRWYGSSCGKCEYLIKPDHLLSAVP
mmetsp:Transcript_14032/g.30373  ORF Transcript_14032/g.30373 Transcript_14032/m.30373 type:complete len:273 (-) Transcript_14032:480-1298(-)